MHDVSHNEALLAAQHLIATLFHHHDTRNFEAEAECFVENAVWNRTHETPVGRAAIIATLNARRKSLITMHVVSNVVLHRVSGDRAEVSFYLTSYSHDDGSIHTGPVVPQSLPSVGIGEAVLLRQGSQWGIEKFATNERIFQAKS